MSKTPFIRFLLAASLLLAVVRSLGAGGVHEWARGVEGQRKADLGNGTYLNPIFPGDHPDPSILKEGTDYYMVFSTFECYPGLVLWHSRDLVNWQPLGPTLFQNVGAVWAPELVKHEGRYYIYFPARGTNYVIWADDLSGRGTGRAGVTPGYGVVVVLRRSRGSVSRS